MAFATWWRGDQLPALPPFTTFVAGPTTDVALLAQVAQLPMPEVEARLRQQHRPYVAWLDGVPTAYGWVATRQAYVGELNLTITLPQEERYLWDFATLSTWRGRGIYPRLLQAILMAEPATTKRFWIIAAPENRASSAGIIKAGFTNVAHLSFQRAGEPGLISMTAGDRAPAAARLLQVPLIQAEPTQVLAPCWHCAIDARQNGRAMAEIACWPVSDELMLTTCQCT